MELGGLVLGVSSSTADNGHTSRYICLGSRFLIYSAVHVGLFAARGAPSPLFLPTTGCHEYAAEEPAVLLERSTRRKVFSRPTMIWTLDGWMYVLECSLKVTSVIRDMQIG
jgi:hypothetical protein